MTGELPVGIPYMIGNGELEFQTPMNWLASGGSGVLWTVSHTPTSNIISTILKISALGDNWSGGSTVLTLNSEDVSCVPLSIQRSGSSVAWFTQNGGLTIGLTLTFTTSGQLITSNGNLKLSPTNGYVIIESSKDTTGDPSGEEGEIYINTFDNKIQMYADGAWRTLASW